MNEYGSQTVRTTYNYQLNPTLSQERALAVVVVGRAPLP
jgi:hypothetical protein